MEIFAELLFTVFGGLIEFLFGLVFQIIAELFSLLLSTRRAVADSPSPFVRKCGGIAAALFGGLLAGYVSLWIAPTLMLDQPWQRVLNFILMPVIVGLLMQLWDNWRHTNEAPAPTLPGFLRGYLFAVAMTATRFIWGK